MKWLYLLTAAGAMMLFALAPTSAQNSAPGTPATTEPGDLPPQVAALINEISAQRKQLATNQAQIDEKVNALAETIRQARLFAARGGGK